ncbi:MAG: TraB/GumN family protein [Hyphomicrobiaceae bacterium]|nr:TraB/GumN family protein [Hyphomicrobiaceae bacterium]
MPMIKPLVLAVVAAMLPALLVAPAVAQKAAPATAAPAPMTPANMPSPMCQGRDMLAELATTDPAAHAAIMAKAAATQNANARLWKIEKEGVAQPSYLMGTIHLTDDRVVTLSPAVEAALASSKVVAVEVAGLGNDKMMSSAMLEAAELMVYTDGRDLSKVLSPAELAAVTEVSADSGMPPEAVRMLRPWVVSMQLAVSMCERVRMVTGAPVLDSRIETLATSKKIRVVGLETVKEQIGAIAKMPEADQVQHLRAGLTYRQRLDDTTATLINLYLTRNLGAIIPLQVHLASKANVGKVPFDTFEKLIITDRNVNMRNRAKPLIDQGGAFIAVGALHLPGKNGLVTLFRNAGYTVTPVVE